MIYHKSDIYFVTALFDNYTNAELFYDALLNSTGNLNWKQIGRKTLNLHFYIMKAQKCPGIHVVLTDVALDIVRCLRLTGGQRDP